jgi:hypothetical protein
MSQIDNAVTSSSKQTALRKGQPLSVSERKCALFQKKGTHKEINVFVQNAKKMMLDDLCEIQYDSGRND